MIDERKGREEEEGKEKIERREAKRWMGKE